MEYLAAFIDIDGTLLDSKGNVSDATRACISKMKNKGIDVVINTGRIFKEAASILRYAGLTAPIISSNGAFIVDSTHKTVISKSILDMRLLKLLDLGRRYRASVGFSTTGAFYCDESFFKLASDLNISWQMRDKKGLIDEPIGIGSDGEWTTLIGSAEIVQCNFFSYETETIDEIYKDVMKRRELTVSSRSAHGIAFNGRGVSKGSGMRRYLDYYGIEIGKSFAIGDSDNDVSMIETAGLGVAMGNAQDVLLRKADYITATNDDDGFSRAVDELLF